MTQKEKSIFPQDSYVLEPGQMCNETLTQKKCLESELAVIY